MTDTTDTLDRQRDIISVNDNPAEQHLQWVRDLIAARAPELSEDDIADAYNTPTEPDPGPAIWLEISERVLDAVEALEERLARIEAELKR